MAWLAAANVPAFMCHRDGDRIDIVSRTPEFASIADAHTGQFDEHALLAQLDSVWPASGGSPAVTTLGDTPDWQCVLQAADDPPTRCVGIVRYTTTDQRYNDAFFTTVETLPDIVSRLDRNHRHLYINPTIERVTGYPAQAFIGKSKRELGLSEQLVRVWEPLVDKVFDTAQPAEQEDELPTMNGPRHFLTRVVPEFGPDGELHTVLSTSHDITELKSLQWQLELLARTDALTSLLNRRGLVERVEVELPRVRRGEGRLSLLLLDVDDFKSINDRFGHLAGNNVLIAIGEVLQQEIGNNDFAARLGGDELCVGLVDTNDAEAEAAVARIRLRITNLGANERCPCGVSVSIGLTTVNEQDHSVSDLLTRADQLMYRDKPRRRNTR
jgi:diguanylate cyclase (GGDEF)-like protein/PAS domain S-box-containing protein